ncbi:ATP-binding cassette domain-containing protein [Ornithinimicrobium sp. INDO-MA30-4]|uniref:ATP-binding cassette domain-containing protein n=1 Tax=Ornithinimicrobium sp. INDO-MA30-4 TaxID=2908651 RepID=UPI001F17E7BB|nr:ATP-binding cassette domain-containing protein [Ornithinimicrobium sp. INDO-MA30-4]UJH70749.1 ATP-binding cassette domain-containing protein [Ornithinimicrobium sp. INDO-MA30-4]
MVGDTEPFLFAGTLQEAIDPQGVCTRAQAEEAMQSAGAHDVYEAVPGGWAGILDERGRGLSGGQRQRLALARALASNPPVLILVEPTSAVDAHTEALIASRLPASRAGQTTVVMTTSPLLLHHAEDVVLLRDGRVVGQGSHDELVAASPEYRAVVLREESHVE